jgi:hypothetical protein
MMVGPSSAAVNGLLEEWFGAGAVPYASAIADVITFVVAFVILVIVGRLVVLPLVDRVLRARDLDEHARLPIRKITWALVVFTAIAAAFGLAGLAILPPTRHLMGRPFGRPFKREFMVGSYVVLVLAGVLLVGL